MADSSPSRLFTSIGRNRQLDNARRSGLVPVGRRFRLSATNSPGQQTQILAPRPALAAHQSPLFTAVVHPQRRERGTILWIAIRAELKLKAITSGVGAKQTPFVLLERTGGAFFRTVALLRYCYFTAPRCSSIRHRWLWLPRIEPFRRAPDISEKVLP